MKFFSKFIYGWELWSKTKQIKFLKKICMDSYGNFKTNQMKVLVLKLNITPVPEELKWERHRESKEKATKGL